MNRDAKTQSALIALARRRRMQRALAHASIHRDAPMPTLRSSLGYMTTTACITDEVPSQGHQMSVLGIARNEGVAYIVEELGADDEAPIVYRLWLRGPRQGHLVPLHAWYEHPASATEIRARIATIARTLEPAMLSTCEAWMLSTRVIQRRALRVGTGACTDLPIRKFALQLMVEPVSGVGPSGKTTVTAFLRPQAQLAEVWSLSSGEAIARITFTGIPNGLGLAKDTVVLLTSGLDDAGDMLA
ncbi:MAG: hypothetical protein H0T89_03795 [Deltaproteobacteria bacterium]|nr:hypothetical protein [Deltaproteobacteria bacterium]MDQ3300462.1 hypothetical protein [Myxococcota bacterium]